MNPLRPVAVRIGAVPWLPRFLPVITWIDKRLQRISAGRVSLLGIAGLPNLMLTVPGRRTGSPRTIPLLCTPDGDGWLIAGSYFGSSTTPAWVHNLRAAETAEIDVRGDRTAVIADELTGAERGAAWSELCRTWPNYAVYERRTDRLIPVFRLTPSNGQRDAGSVAG